MAGCATVRRGRRPGLPREEVEGSCERGREKGSTAQIGQASQTQVNQRRIRAIARFNAFEPRRFHPDFPGRPDIAIERIAYHQDFARVATELFGRITEDRGIWFEKADAPRIYDHGEKRRVTEVGAELVHVATAIRDDAELKTAFH